MTYHVKFLYAIALECKYINKATPGGRSPSRIEEGQTRRFSFVEFVEKSRKHKYYCRHFYYDCG
jgi:hypothetical protein